MTYIRKKIKTGTQKTLMKKESKSSTVILLLFQMKVIKNQLVFKQFLNIIM